MKRRLAGALILSLGLALAASAPAHDREAPRVAAKSKDIKQEKKELDRLRRKLEEQKRYEKAARKKEKSVLSNMDSLDRRLNKLQKELHTVNRKLDNRTRSLRELEDDIGSLRRELDSKKDRVRSRIRMLYQENRMNTLRILFASKDYYDFMKRYSYLAWISQTESELISGYRETLARLGDKEEKLKSAHVELVDHRREVAAKAGQIRDAKREKQGLLASVRKDRALHKRAIEELTDSANRMTALIQELEKKRKSATVGLGFPKLKGKMPWPASGKVVGFFGRQKHPKFDTLINRKGIEIESGLGQPIRAVFPGKVVYADWFRGFGLLVILDHGDDYYSLYAHAAKLSISIGDEVKSRQVIGEIGDTGLTGEPNLYFEIRHGDKPVNPLGWLKRK